MILHLGPLELTIRRRAFSVESRRIYFPTADGKLIIWDNTLDAVEVNVPMEPRERPSCPP